jgi:hypothetical protein
VREGKGIWGAEARGHDPRENVNPCKSSARSTVSRAGKVRDVLSYQATANNPAHTCLTTCVPVVLRWGVCLFVKARNGVIFQISNSVKKGLDVSENRESGSRDASRLIKSNAGN